MIMNQKKKQTTIKLKNSWIATQSTTARNDEFRQRNIFLTTLLITVLGIFISSNQLFALNLTPQQEQTLKSSEYNPGSLLMQKMQELQRYRTEQEAVKMKENSSIEEDTKTENTKEEAPNITVKVEKLEIPDSEVLSRDELDQISDKYSDKVLSISDLYEAIEEINKLYAKKGYITACAVLPPQKIENNIVKIMLLEGKIGQVLVENNKKTKTAYIKRFLNIPEGIVPNVNKIRRKIQKFNNTNKTLLQIKMVAGEKPMTTDFYIVAIEPKKHNTFNIFTDNSGSESSGKYRYGLSYSNTNLSGHCDIFNLTSMYSKTSGTNMLSYNTPIGFNGDRVSFSHNANNMRVSKGYMKDLDVRGKSRNTSLTYYHPVLTRADLKNDIIFDIQKQKSSTTILGNEFAIDRDTRYSIAYSSMIIKKNNIFYFKPTYIYNKHRNIDNDHFNGERITLETMWQKYLKQGNITSLRVSTQKDLGDKISSTDQYYLGGQYSVRGYHENVIGGESGVNVKFDYSFRTKKKGLNFVTFFDWGKLSGETILSTKEIYSAGFGFDYQYKNLYLTIYTGYPLKREIGNNRIDKKITHFTLNYSF